VEHTPVLLRFEVGFGEGEDQVIHLRKRLMQFLRIEKQPRRVEALPHGEHDTTKDLYELLTIPS
jgi:hypothetical protein